MNLDLTKQWISRWEGSRSQVYKDTKGIPTIGVGLNLTTQAAQSAIAALGIDINSLLDGSLSLTDDQIDQLLTGSINLALVTAHNLVQNFDNLPDNQQLVITDLAFNMGQPVFSKFVNTLNFINRQDWPNAAANLQQSAWFHQVGSAADERGGADIAVLGNTANPQDILGA